MDTTRVTGLAQSYQVKEKMTTPSGGTYTQNDGDTYIGRSTNMLFGRGDRIGVYKQTDGSNKIDKKPSLCVGREFSTTFVYSQAYIEQTLIPNWKQAVKNLLVTVNGVICSGISFFIIAASCVQNYYFFGEIGRFFE